MAASSTPECVHVLFNTRQSDFEKFEKACSLGELDTSKNVYLDISSLPGISYFTGDEAEFYWIRGASAILNLLAFERIVQLDTDYDKRLQEWTNLKLTFNCHLTVDTLEEISFKKVEAAAAAVNRAPPCPVTRSHVLLSKLPAPEQKLIREKAGKLHLGSSGRTRAWILDRFEVLLAAKAHTTSVCNGSSTDAGAPVSGSTICKDCSTKFAYSGNASQKVPGSLQLSLSYVLRLRMEIVRLQIGDTVAEFY